MIECLQTNTMNIKINIGWIEFVIGRFQWQGAAKDVMTCLGTCELCLCVSIVCVLHAHFNCFMYMTVLYVSVCCAGTVPPHKASGTCQHTDCWLFSSSHWASTVSCHKECSTVTEGEPVRLCSSHCLCLFSAHESVITKWPLSIFSFILYLFILFIYSSVHPFIHSSVHPFIHVSIN